MAGSGRVGLRCRCRCGRPAPAPGRRRVGVEDVAAHPLAHRDDRVGALRRDPLAHGRQRVAAAELLGLPRPQRLQGVGGHDVRDAVQQARPRWPARLAYQVCECTRSQPATAAAIERSTPRSAARRWRRRARAGRGACTVDARLARSGGPRAEAVHVDVDQPAQLGGQIFDVAPRRRRRSPAGTHGSAARSACSSTASAADLAGQREHEAADRLGWRTATLAVQRAVKVPARARDRARGRRGQAARSAHRRPGQAGRAFGGIYRLVDFVLSNLVNAGYLQARAS